MTLPDQPHNWHRPGFLISTDKTLLSLAAINKAFSSDQVYWAKPMPEDVLQAMIEKSFYFGLYEVSTGPHAGTTAGNGSGNGSDFISAETGLCQIGFARLVGDMVTFVYVTDLYVLEEYQGRRVGGWLIDCIGEMVEGMPWLRWAMLRTSMEKSQKAYEKRLGMEVLRSGDVREGPVMMGRKGGCGGP